MNDFLDKLKNDPRVDELVKALPAPKSEEEAVAGYLSVASQLGFNLSREEMIAALQSLAREKAEKSDKVSLADDDLEKIAGGGVNEACDTTFDKGEWCWFSDSCSLIINDYSDVYQNLRTDVAFDVCVWQDNKHDDYKVEFPEVPDVDPNP